MTRLMMILFSFISVTLMGICMVIALVTGNDTLTPIVVSAAIGFVAAVPASFIIARKLA
ncbi:CTP synthetase [Cereibacter sediminicola]|uniref:CTP synthetase n=1 Tax=Cereibacter sediminicola TaxID=2584941 RepID=UPI0011A0320A|nr:CTP synthetase [Cereibacter sediminicola]